MTFAELIARYQPLDDVEAADLLRIRGLSANAWDRSTPLHLTASAVIVHSPTRRVLLRWHQRQQAWLQVGGHADPGETDPLAIALREAEEETGLKDLTPVGGLLHVAVVSVAPNAVEPAHEHADLRFVLETTDPDAARPENPDAPVRWLTIDDAIAEVAQDNLRKTLHRMRDLMDT